MKVAHRLNVPSPWLSARLGSAPRHVMIRMLHGNKPMAETIAYEDFERVDIRVGTIVDAQPFPQARKPSIKLVIDFGAEIGTKRSAAQLTVHYKPDQLIGRQVCAVVNFPPRQIGPFMSEVLTLGMPDEDGAVVLVRPDFKVPNGGRLF
jgi:tRNA-binding protein